MTVTPNRVDGADISHHQDGKLDLAASRKAGLKFLYHKVSEGNTYVDPNYARRRAEADAAGISFGGYHFARPEKGDAETEAKHFIENLKPKPGDALPVLDLEVAGGLTQDQLWTWANTFVSTVKKLTGFDVIVYGPYFADRKVPWLRWVPRYNNTNTPPTGPWDIWQFSDGAYGIPRSFPGLGAVDLNTFRDGLGLRDILIPKAKPPVVHHPDAVRVNCMHTSMQFSDATPQKKSDVLSILGRAKDRGVAWITGTEGGAGSQDLIAALKTQAPKYGYRLWTHPATDAWILVSEAFIDGGWKGYWGGEVVPGEAHKHTTKGVLAVGFDNAKLGRINIIAAHYLTKGRPDAHDPTYSQFVKENRDLATAIGKYAAEAGAGSALVFYGGDQNIVDRTSDSFFGQPLTSVWDELGKWESTGHGNIDVIASYDNDGRVTAAYINALDDTEFNLNTDHFAVEAGFDIKPLKQK